MTNAFNPRVVILGIQVGGEVLFFKDLDIRASGQKSFSPSSTLCNIMVSNLTRETRNYLLTKASPYPTIEHPNLDPAFVTLDVGREIGGTFRLFEGYVYTSTVKPPPDIGIVLQANVESIMASVIINMSLGPLTNLSVIAKQVAEKNGKILNFTATDRQIGNFSFTGKAGKLIPKLQMIGDVRVCIDNDQMIVVDKNQYRNAPRRFLIDQDHGMIGVPQANQSGVTVKILITPDVQIGDNVSLRSKINPSVNGDNYIVSNMFFEVANRDQPFYYTLNLTNNSALVGTQ